MADVDRMAIARAAKAQALLNDAEFQSAFAAVRASLLSRIEACPVRDADGLHTLHLQLNLLKQVQQQIQHVVNTGKVVEERASFLERVGRLAKRGLADARR